MELLLSFDIAMEISAHCEAALFADANAAHKIRAIAPPGRARSLEFAHRSIATAFVELVRYAERPLYQVPEMVPLRPHERAQQFSMLELPPAASGYPQTPGSKEKGGASEAVAEA
jgi:hypothetical protein